MQYKRDGPERLVEEGSLEGTLNGQLVVHINTGTAEITRFTIATNSGTLTGSAPNANYSFTATAAQFHDKGWITKGTGSFAGIRPSPITFNAVADRLRETITNTATAELIYR
jgi:hypothetical protein